MEMIQGAQGTELWFEKRIGSIGGSSISKVVAKSKELKQRTKLLYDLAGEIISGVKTESYSNKHMENGNLYEDDARQYYSLVNGIEIEQIALLRDHPHKHYSPDGLIGKDGLIEIKNLIPSIFIEHFETKSIPTAYRRQIQWGLKRSEREWCDYVVYCKLFEGKCNPMLSTRIYRDETEIDFLEKECDFFIDEMLSLVDKIKQL